MPLERTTGPINKRGGATVLSLTKIGFAIASRPGTKPVASGVDAVAIGDAASATGARSVAFGIGATTGVNVGAIAIGDTAIVNATSAAAIALGDGAVVNASSQGAIAIGQVAFPFGIDSICIGGSSFGTSGDSRCIAIGSGANTTGVNDAVAIGRDAVGGGTSAVAIGDGASASAASAIVIGNVSSVGAGSNSSIAIGDAAIVAASVNDAIAIGSSAQADFVHSFAFGTNARTHFIGDVAFPGWQDANYTHKLTGLSSSSSNATPDDMLNVDFGDGISIPSGMTYAISGILAARTSAGLSAMWEFTALVKNVAGTSTLVNSSIAKLHDETAGISASLAVNDATDAFNISRTGIAATNIRWQAAMRIAAVVF